MKSGKTLGELFFENDQEKLAALDVDFNKKNRVTAAQFASKEAIANTPRSPRFNNSIPQNSDLSTGKTNFNRKEAANQQTSEDIDALIKSAGIEGEATEIREDLAELRSLPSVNQAGNRKQVSPAPPQFLQ